MAKKNNNQVSAVRQAKHGWIWTFGIYGYQHFMDCTNSGSPFKFL